MRTSLLRIALALLVSIFALVAVTVPLQAGELTWTLNTTPADVSVKSSASGDQVLATGDSYQYVTAPEQPMLPYRIISMLLSPGETVVGTRVDAGEDVVVGRGVTPMLAPAFADNGSGMAPATATFNTQGVYPAERAVFLGVGYLRGFTIASFALYPIRVDNGDLTVATSLTLHVTTGPDASGIRVARRLRQREGFRADMQRELSATVVNPQLASAYPLQGAPAKKTTGGFQPTSYPSLEGSDVDYVIITNDSLAATFQTLADWKTAKGVPTVVRTTEWIDAHYRNGADPAETIRTFILDAYQQWGITYVLLGGDTDQIPVRLGHSLYQGDKTLPADMYFGCLDGDWNANHNQYFGEAVSVDQTDLYPEVYTGRLPAVDNATAASLIAKIESYETPVDPSYTGKTLLLAEVLFPIDWQSGQSVTQDGADIADYLYLLAFTNPALTVQKNYQNYVPHPGSLPETAAAAIASLNEGYDQVNHIGHGFRFNMSCGDASISNADADALTNTNRYSNLFLLSCTGVAFTYYCLGEHFLRNPVGGAVSVIGSSESVYPLVAQPYMDEYYKLLYVDHVEHIGEAYARSKFPRTPIAMQSDNSDLYMHYAYAMLADPEMPIWTEPVQALTVTYPASIGIGTTPIMVHVSDALGNVAGARVCLSKGTDDYKVGVTDASGNVTLSMTAKSAGSVRIVATALNRGRYDANITVTPSAGAYVTYDSETIDDDALAGTNGNADGVIDAGETIDFTVRVKNTGGVSASNITLALRASQGGVTVADSVATVGSVASGGATTASDPFRVVFASSLADNTPVKFTLAVKQNGVTAWTDHFTRIVHAPSLDFDVLRIDDAGTGNGDGVVQAGENFHLHYRLKNFGTGAAHAVHGTLVDLSGGVFTIFNNADTYGDLPSIGAVEDTVGFYLSESNVASPHNLRLDVTDAYGRLWQKTFELRPPDPPTNLVCDPSLGPDRLVLTWSASGSLDVNRYQVYRSGTPGGPYDLVSVDPVHYTTFLDRGLYPTTTYYYRLSALDASGNESALSPETVGNTNPKQVEGWPITMAAETVSSPVVGDIDGDHTFEILVGDTKVYAWHHNGVEVRDGDGNAQTWGLFSTLGNNFVSHLALADIDTVPGLDILAASRDTREVFAFNYTGSVIAGWPQTVLNAIRAGLVAGDIDGDGTKEVIAIDEHGVLYVWHPDGTEYRDGDHDVSTNGVFRKFGGCVYQYGCPAMGDLDGDGIDEMVVGTQGDSLFVLNADGSSAPGWPKAFPSPVAGAPAVGDIDGDGGMDVVVHLQSGDTYAFKGDGTQLWYRWAPDNLSFSPSPALGDLDGDGKLETLIPSKDRNLYAIRWNGTDLPGWPVVYATSSWTESSPVIADLDNNGVLDVVLGNENKYIDAWDATGQPVAGFPLAMSDAVRATPEICDLDKDGDVEVIAAGWDKTVRVWDFPKMFNPQKAPWAKYHANLYNDGNPTTQLPTPVSGATFAYSIRPGRLELRWHVPLEAGAHFGVDRADVVGGVATGYHRVASNVAVTPDGVVQWTDTSVEMGARYSFRLVGESGATLNETASLYVPVARAGLGQNFPNPFNPSTHIEYWVPDQRGPRQSTVSLVIYDVRGARVRTLVNATQPAGRYRVQWDGRNDDGAPVSSGIYFYRMATTNFSETRKMLLLK
ncbi:MAG TPA: C25 family cysteine peptidase [Candidatus Krumholzibacteria bacterium]|nr:C25 family cysteine peptidase [Candidatus Krumholzibacteria bacterium]